jgi:chemotaxis protein methyltransferase CheR
MTELGLDDFDAYRRYLRDDDTEWFRLDAMCRITISRFYRDRGVFEALTREVLPALVESARKDGRTRLQAWSCGCGSGEEPYTLAMVWQLGLGERFAGFGLEIVATDVDPKMLARAQRGAYSNGSLKEIPERWRGSVFTADGDDFSVASRFRQGIRWLCQDVRCAAPPGAFDLVLCRNLVFTYYEESLQLELEKRLAGALRPSGALVIGAHESLPAGSSCFARWVPGEPIYRRTEAY